MKRILIVHPLLFAVYPVLALLAHNINWIPVSDAVRSLLVVLISTVILLLSIRLLIKYWDKASLIFTLFVLSFFSYGHVYSLLRSVDLGFAIGRHRYLIPLWITLTVAGSWWILRTRARLQIANSFLNVVAIASLILPLYTIAAYQFQFTTNLSPVTAVQHDPSNQLSIPEGEEPPDVYYIIVDAYARADILEEVFHYDNTPFIEYLTNAGFYIADGSRSNYAQSSLSITSSLNFDYIQNLINEVDTESTNRAQLWNLLQHSQTHRNFEDLGYKSVAFSTGLRGTEILDADIYFNAGSADELVRLGAANSFEGMLIRTSAGLILTDTSVALPRFFPDLKYPYRLHQSKILNIFEHLEELPDLEGPKFVFAHIISPHPPFVFGRNGQLLIPDQTFTLGFTFASDEPESAEKYLEGYREQLIYINSRLQEVIDAILTKSKTPPIIILQSDHGPDGKSSTVSYVQQRMTILNAYYLPDAGATLLYPTITPVNSFRVVFNHYFGGGYELLPDKIYYSEYRRPYMFMDLTDKIDIE